MRFRPLIYLLLFAALACAVVVPSFNAMMQGETTPDAATAEAAPAPTATPEQAADDATAARLRELVQPLDDPADYRTVLDAVGDARLVLIGEASHGTEEFYRIRADLTRLLIEEKGFDAVAVEADWHSAFRVNEYVRGTSRDRTAEQALGDFTRFPIWMWRNTIVRDFIEWMHDYNAKRRPGQPEVGFYGLDLYGMAESIDVVMAELEAIDPQAAHRAQARYGCFSAYGVTGEDYASVALDPAGETCEAQALGQLSDVKRLTNILEPLLQPERRFSLEQNARVVTNAEMYYRAAYDRAISTWNLRDEHMAETVTALLKHLGDGRAPAKLVVWAHNSHIGDAGATEMWQRGELSLGHLLREAYGGDAVLIGFSTYDGSVTAAHNWGESPVVMAVNPSLPESYSALFHKVGLPRFLLMPGDDEVSQLLDTPRLERAIGVIYRPRTERWSHYFEADLPRQFDVMIYIDRTTAVRPLDAIPGWQPLAPAADAE